MSKFYMGIDPGASGAIVLLDGTGKTDIEYVYRMPSAEDTLIRLLRWLQPKTLLATIEAQHAFPNSRKMPDGSTRYQNQTGQVKFVGGYQFIRGFLMGNGYAVDTVQPVSWQKTMGCLTRGNKTVSLNKAKQIWPEIGVALWNADALLIAEYGRLKTLGKLGLRSLLEPEPF